MSKSDVAELKINQIGQSVLRREDKALLTGRAKYIADIDLPGMLHSQSVCACAHHPHRRQHRA